MTTLPLVESLMHPAILLAVAVVSLRSCDKSIVMRLSDLVDLILGVLTGVGLDVVILTIC